MRIAVVGGGAAGLAAAWALSKRHDTVLFEAADYPGGHANTIDIEVGGRTLPVDTGFIVYNEPNYPNLTRLFEAVGAETEASSMSFSVSLGRGRVEYAGSAFGLFAQPANLCRPDHWRMVRDVLRFGRAARALLTSPAEQSLSLGQMLAHGGYSEVFARRHLLPMAAAIWSSTLDGILDFPAHSFARFFANHGLLDLRNRPRWRTVSGGSRTYVARLIATGGFETRTGTKVHGLVRSGNDVRVRFGAGEEDAFDQIVFATPAHRTLDILGTDASPLERGLLGAFGYQANRAVVHRDRNLLPRRRRVWASWNYLADDDSARSEKVSVSYWMNRLQNLPVAQPVVVSLNPISEPAPETVFAEFRYEHPQFDQAAVDAQRLLPAIQGVNGTWFCGSYCGYGFHEDAVQGGLAVAAALGARVPWYDAVVPRSPAAFAVTDPTAAVITVADRRPMAAE